jgi:hypothetical protein
MTLGKTHITLPARCQHLPPPPLRHRPHRSHSPSASARLLTSLSRVQIRGLFHRHVSKERIDLALEQLLKLGLINRGTAAGRGRSASLWTKAQEPETALNTPKPTLMAHKALKAHTSTRRALKALKAHTSTQRALKALKAHTSTQRAHRALKAHTSTQRAHGRLRRTLPPKGRIG